MCGIFGFNGNNPKNLNLMGKLISHRGPDFLGSYFNNDISLGHVLLSIRGDLELSTQPMITDDGRFIIIFNGEIYNTEFLIEKKLKGAGFEDTMVDSLVLKKLIEREGINFVNYIQGMFAIAVFDVVEKKLSLYRDQSGQKNIYYYYDGKSFIFCSEIKGILGIPGIQKVVNPQGVQEALWLGYITSENTHIKNIYQLSPGQCLEYDLNKTKVTSYFFESHQSSFPRYIGLREAIQDTVRTHLFAKHKVGINLSGGVDSTIIAYEAYAMGQKLQAYTTEFIGGPDTHSEDSKIAQKFSKDIGFPIELIQISKKDYLDAFIPAYECIEVPNYNVGIPLYYCVAHKEGARGDGNRVIFSGDGGDEVFGGYKNYLLYLKSRKIISQIRNFIKYYHGKITGKDDNYYLLDPLVFNLRGRFLGDKIIASDQEGFRIIYDFLKQSFFGNLSKNPVQAQMQIDRLIWLSHENFIRSDKLYMSQSIEVRNPFAYTPLRNYVDYHFSNSIYIKEKRNKIFLRDQYQGILPKYITERETKWGWRAPHEWWWDNGFKNFYLDIIPKKDNLIKWSHVRKYIEKQDKYPHKKIHALLSIAIISRKQGIEI